MEREHFVFLHNVSSNVAQVDLQLCNHNLPGTLAPLVRTSRMLGSQMCALVLGGGFVWKEYAFTYACARFLTRLLGMGACKVSFVALILFCLFSLGSALTGSPALTRSQPPIRQALRSRCSFVFLYFSLLREKSFKGNFVEFLIYTIEGLIIIKHSPVLWFFQVRQLSQRCRHLLTA